MLICRTIVRPLAGQFTVSLFSQAARTLLTLAIETSCDDTSVAVVERYRHDADKDHGFRIHYHEKITSNNLALKGIHPSTAVEAHQEHCASLVHRAIQSLPRPTIGDEKGVSTLLIHQNGEKIHVRKPQLVCATRGPGIRSSLMVGHELAKGLAIAWQRPYVGVHHMQAHALTARMISAMSQRPRKQPLPRFPFMTLLVSGGHTDLIISKDIFVHSKLASTADSAIGNALDKIARFVLPTEVMDTATNVMYGAMLEKFAFPNGNVDYCYSPPETRGQEMKQWFTQWGTSMRLPFSDTKANAFSFASITSTLDQITASGGKVLDLNERVDLAREAMTAAFEHVAAHIVYAHGAMQRENPGSIARLTNLVVSGGVAANKFLKHVLREYLDSHGMSHIELTFPPAEFCTDNAVMIGWAGMEVYEDGWQSRLSCNAIKTWSLDPDASDRGILGASGWMKRI